MVLQVLKTKLEVTMLVFYLFSSHSRHCHLVHRLLVSGEIRLNIVMVQPDMEQMFKGMGVGHLRVILFGNLPIALVKVLGGLIINCSLLIQTATHFCGHSN